MKFKLLLFLLFLITNLHANSDREDLHSKIKSLKFKGIDSEIVSHEFSVNSLLKAMKKNARNKAAIHDTFSRGSYSFDKLKSKFFNISSWQPEFCEELNLLKSLDITECFNKLINIIGPYSEKKFSVLYLNGDEESADFKVLYLFFKNKKSDYLLLRLNIQEERY
jgi:hypothetical protein